MEVERREWKVESCTRLSAVHCRGGDSRARHCTGGKCGPMLKRQWPPSLSLRGAKRRGALSAKREEVPLGCNLGKAFTTRMCEAGVNVKVIQDTLGHKDISTTLNIYTDVTKELRQSEFEGLDSYFKSEYNKVSNE